jgi:hypothetical protein
MDDTLTYKDGIELLQTKGSKMLQTVCQFIYFLISILTIEVYTHTYHELCTVDISLGKCTIWNIVFNKNYLMLFVIILVPLYIQARLKRLGKCSNVCPIVLMCFNMILSLERDILKSPHNFAFPRL